jgi:hypothetical protein
MKPSDLFVGISDFFGIVLPGAVTLFVVMEVLARLGVPEDHVVAQMTGTRGWVASCVIAYVAGHFIASLGARLDQIYDKLKGSHRNPRLAHDMDGFVQRFLRGVNDLSADETASVRADPPKVRWPARFVLLPFRCAWREADAQPPEQISAYKLAKTILSLQAPAALGEVTRLEADSKFFRSFVVVALFAIAVCATESGFDIKNLVQERKDALPKVLWGAGYLVGASVTMWLAFSRFCELRLKATETAFQLVLALEVASQKAASHSAAPGAALSPHT